MGQDKQGRYMWKRAGKKFSLTRGQGQDGRIREVLQENSPSSMYKVYDYVTCVKESRKLRCCVLPALNSLCLINLSVIIRHCYWLDFSIDCLFFCRLKINHDSHGFILEFGTVAYNKLLHFNVFDSVWEQCETMQKISGSHTLEN